MIKSFKLIAYLLYANFVRNGIKGYILQHHYVNKDNTHQKYYSINFGCILFYVVRGRNNGSVKAISLAYMFCG